MENCTKEQQSLYFKSFFYPCSLNITSALIEKREYSKGLKMLRNIEETLAKQQWGDIGSL
jgi:hypothetical protein